jgi:hypothetical protein
MKFNLHWILNKEVFLINKNENKKLNGHKKFNEKNKWT